MILLVDGWDWWERWQRQHRIIGYLWQRWQRWLFLLRNWQRRQRCLCCQLFSLSKRDAKLLPQDRHCCLDSIDAIGFSLRLLVRHALFLTGLDVVGYFSRFDGVPCLVGFVGFHNVLTVKEYSVIPLVCQCFF